MTIIDRARPIPELTRAVAALAKRPASAAIAGELVGLLAAPPFTSAKTKALWTAVVAQLGGKHAVAESVAPLTALAADYQKIFGRTVMGTWLEGELRTLVAGLVERFPKAPRVVAAPPKDKPTKRSASGEGRRGSIAELFAQVAARPDDDAPRLVLADALLEQGDPRGEFIASQLRATRTAAELAREKALLKKHEKAWLGPVAETTIAPSRVWRRGFLDECYFKSNGRFDSPSTGHPAWATVRTLKLRSFYGAKGLPVLMDPVLRGVRALEDPSHDVAIAIATSDPPWAIERLKGWLVDEERRILPELLAARGLPRLRELELTERFPFDIEADVLRPLWKSPLGKQLGVLRFQMYDNRLAAFSAEILEHARIPVEITTSVVVRFDRDTLAVRPPPNAAFNREIAPLLAELPAKRFETVEIEESLRSADVDRAAARLRR